MLDQFPSFLFMFFIYQIFLMCFILILNCCLFSFVFVSFSTKTFTFRIFIHGCLFGGRLGFSPRRGPLSPSPSQFVQQRCAHCGDSGEVSAPGQLSGFHQAAQNSFSGAFRNSNPNFHIPYLPHHYIFLFQNQAPSKVKCHRTVLLQGSDSDRKAC